MPKNSDPPVKTGDVVKLLSGGPLMTVERVDGPRMTVDHMDGYVIHCVWFGADHGHPQRAFFQDSMLTFANDHK